MRLLKVLFDDPSAVVHIATATYPSTADALCGLKQVVVRTHFWTAGHRDAPMGVSACRRCLALESLKESHDSGEEEP